MSSPIQKIKELIPYLPEGDIRFAQKYLDKKDYDSLKDLTWSALLRLEKAFQRGTIPDKYRGIDIDKVRELALECNEYYYLIYPEELEVEDDFYDDEVEDE